MDKEEASDKIDGILPCVWNDGLLTDIECRKIVSTQQPDKKIAAAYEIIMSKKIPAALDLIGKFDGVLPSETCKGLLSEIENHECDSDSECNCNFVSDKTDNNYDSDFQCAPVKCDFDCKGDDEKKNNPNKILAAQKNPFLQTVVIECLLGFLAVREIKNARLVCRIWDSTSELILRKRAAICFCPNIFRPADFLAAFKYSLVELPFSSFKFYEYNDTHEKEEDEEIWRVSEIQNFFDEWGKNIKELNFTHLLLADGRKFIQYNITPWFENLENITKLEIHVASQDYVWNTYMEQTLLAVSLAPLFSIKTILLAEVCLLLNKEDQISQISPSKMSLINIHVKIDGEDVDEYTYNDFVDFSQVINCMISNSNCCHYLDPTAIFDMGRHVLKADQLCLLDVDVRNWEGAKGSVNYLHLYACDFTVRNQLKIKQLNFEYSKIDLYAIPNTIEKIRLSKESIQCSKEIQLDHLNYLNFHVYQDNSQDLLHFANCANLIELELITTLGESNSTIIHLECIPKTIQKCRINGLRITFSPNDNIWELDTLILQERPDEGPLFINCRNILTKIKPKNLVLVYSGWIELDTSDLITFIVDNEQIDKVVVGTYSEGWDLHTKVQYEGSLLSLSVDKKSNYYLFENQIGRAITQNEFKQYTKMNSLVDDFYI